MEKKKIWMVSVESEPFAKTGGLGDVVGSLPRSLNELGCDCRVLMPLHQLIKDQYKEKMNYLGYLYIDVGWRHQYCGVFDLIYQGVHFYFVDNKFYFNHPTFYNELDLEKFSFLDLACFEVARYIKFKPDIIHIHDWHTGAIAALLNDYYYYDPFFKNTKTVYTIHNLAYQGIFDKEAVLSCLPLNRSKYNNTNTINLMALGIQYAYKVTTVSPTYAKEILTDSYGEGLQYLLRQEQGKLVGILNGIDGNSYNCKLDSYLAYNFDEKDFVNGKRKNKEALLSELGFDVASSLDKPLLAVVSRLASQKGMDLLLKIIRRLLERDIRIVILGTGNKELEEAFSRFNGDKLKALITFDNRLAHKIYASSDLFLMPSAFEPCGLAQMISLRYGTLPLVRSCGGLHDSIIPFNEYTLTGNGFSFNNYNANDFYNTILYALSVYERKDLWNIIIKNGFASNFSWQESAKKYIELYQSI